MPKGCYSPILGKRTSALHIILAYVGVASGLLKIGISSVKIMLEKKGRYGATQSNG